MQLISRFNKGIRFLFCVIDIYIKYAWAKDKKGSIIVNAFQKIIDDLKLKPNNIWADKESEFYNRSMKSCLEKYDIEMHSTHNEGKSAVVKRLIRTLKSKIYKYMTWVSKNVYIDKLDDIVDEYNNTYHRTIKMKPVDVMSGNYNEYNVNSKDKLETLWLFSIETNISQLEKKTVDCENLFFKALANGQYQKVIYGSTKLFMADHLLNALHEKVNDLSLKVGQM